MKGSEYPILIKMIQECSRVGPHGRQVQSQQLPAPSWGCNFLEGLGVAEILKPSCEWVKCRVSSGLLARSFLSCFQSRHSKVTTITLLHRRGRAPTTRRWCLLFSLSPPVSVQMSECANFLLWRFFFWVRASLWVNDPYPPNCKNVLTGLLLLHMSLFQHILSHVANFKVT